jgi:hypothetical protein
MILSVSAIRGGTRIFGEGEPTSTPTGRIKAISQKPISTLIYAFFHCIVQQGKEKTVLSKWYYPEFRKIAKKPALQLLLQYVHLEQCTPAGCSLIAHI